MKTETAKHTPGPWREYNSKGGLIFKNWRIWDGKAIICKVYECASAEQEFFNTRLIAAAPDLLAALEFSEAALCDLFEDLKAYGDQSRLNQVTAVGNMVRAAILKATEGK